MKKFLIYFLIFLTILIIVLAITFRVASAPITRNLLMAVKEIPLVVAEPEITPPTIVTTNLMFGGDVMLSRVVNQKSTKYQDWTWPLKKIASTTAAADLFIINLESPFTISGSHLVKTGSFSFKADPKSLAALTLAGVDVVALANNHTINQGRAGIADTQKILAEAGLAFSGAGLNENEARTPAIKEVNGLKIGFLSYAYPDDYSIANGSNFGLAGLDISKMKADVQKLKPQVDLIAVIMHAGYEYTNQPNQQQKDFARQAIEASADLVIGHHPHWVQIIEIYQGKPILYSLGNLVFDQMWSKETQEGALAKVILEDKTIKAIEIIPIIIKDYGQAELADTKTSEAILKRMGLKSPTLIINN